MNSIQVVCHFKSREWDRSKLAHKSPQESSLEKISKPDATISHPITPPLETRGHPLQQDLKPEG